MATKTVTPPEFDLLTLQSLAHHPAVQEAVQAKAPQAQRLAAIEAALLAGRKQLAFAAGAGHDPATAAVVAGKAREELATLEKDHSITIAALRIANAAIAEVTAQTRLEILPELARLVIPEIDRRLHGLALIDAAQRLVGRSTPLRSVREAYKLERRYLTELRDLLTAQDPS